MKNILGSVGFKGQNRKSDVVIAQEALNKKIPVPLAALQVDGACGPKMIFAIREYQRRVLHIARPDGLILPQGPTWKSLVGKNTAADSLSARSGQTAQALVKLPEILAMLDVLGFSEGTNDRYDMLVYGTVIKSQNPADIGKVNMTFTDFSQHPNILVQCNSTLKSTAAGRYQFLYQTWTELKLPDFYPANQDIGAVKLFQRRKMIEPLLRGDIDQAVQRGCLEWASLPDAANKGASHYGGQPSRSLVELKQKYTQSLAKYLGKSLNKEADKVVP